MIMRSPKHATRAMPDGATKPEATAWLLQVGQSWRARSGKRKSSEVSHRPLCGSVAAPLGRWLSGGSDSEIMRFGILIRMFYREHELPHFHAEYQRQHAKFDFNGQMIAGEIQSGTALRLIREWASLHRAELETDWRNMKTARPLNGSSHWSEGSR